MFFFLDLFMQLNMYVVKFWKAINCTATGNNSNNLCEYFETQGNDAVNMQLPNIIVDFGVALFLFLLVVASAIRRIKQLLVS